MVGMALGLATGFATGSEAVLFKPLGDLFLNAIKMLIVPLVFCSLVSSVTSMNDTSKMGRVAFKSIALYLSTGAVAITIGLLIGNFFAPGGKTARSKVRFFYLSAAYQKGIFG